MVYNINLDNFSGPLDLLLNLIKEKKINIFDVDLLELTTQYLEIVSNQQKLNMDIAVEYLYMASYLLEVKSKLLIPKEKVEMDEKTEDEIRNDLIQKLLEYKKIKKVAVKLKEKYTASSLFLGKPETNVKVKKNILLEKDNIDNLISAMMQVFERLEYKEPKETNVVIKEYSLEETSGKIINFLISRTKKKTSLISIVENFGYNKKMLITCFVAILDLVKKAQVTLQQDNVKDDIKITFIDNKEN